VHRIGQTNTGVRLPHGHRRDDRGAHPRAKVEKKQLFNQVVGGTTGDFEWTKHFSSLNSLIQLSAVESGEAELLNPPWPSRRRRRPWPDGSIIIAAVHDRRSGVGGHRPLLQPGKAREQSLSARAAWQFMA